eukprot:maker-scaffold190_size271632-snap-gene-1.29 protein:Tk12377 transcript:maker-scaffold190_size271632-snap-gene-1.29-mRNA-1 annotation:"hypothetical protein BRAFLDRAFT_275202"
MVDGTLLIVCLRKSTNENREALLNSTGMFLAECEFAQMSSARSLYAHLCHDYAQQLVRRGQPILGISPLTKAVGKLQENLNATYLTSVHSDLCLLCLSAKNFNPAMGFLATDFTDITFDASSECKYILLYYYYGGMILLALKNYSRALHFFEICVTTPAVSVSHIMLEAYKKLILVALIEQGDKTREVLNLPKYTSYVVQKYLKPLSTPYWDVLNAYFAIEIQALRSTVTKHTSVFETDSNMGLVEQVLESQTKTNIKRLTRTFLTLSLAELAQKVLLPSAEKAEKLVVEMIQDGSIHAKISQKDGMVRFNSNPEHFNSAEVLEQLEAKITRCMNLDNQINNLTELIELNRDYVKRSGTSSATGTASFYSSASSSQTKDEAGGSMGYASNGSLIGSSGGPAPSSSSSGPSVPMGNGKVPFS